jgi:hypothetical protein
LGTKINPSKRYQGSLPSLALYLEALKDGNNKCVCCGYPVQLSNVSSFSRRYVNSKWQWFLICKNDYCERMERSGKYAD